MTAIPASRMLEDLLRDAIRSRDYSLATERQFLHWYRAYVRYHKMQHPRLLVLEGVRQFEHSEDDVGFPRLLVVQTQGSGEIDLGEVQT